MLHILTLLSTILKWAKYINFYPLNTKISWFYYLHLNPWIISFWQRFYYRLRFRIRLSIYLEFHIFILLIYKMLIMWCWILIQNQPASSGLFHMNQVVLFLLSLNITCENLTCVICEILVKVVFFVSVKVKHFYLPTNFNIDVWLKTWNMDKSDIISSLLHCKNINQYFIYNLLTANIFHSKLLYGRRAACSRWRISSN